MEVVESLPQLRVLEQFTDPQSLLELQGEVPDLVLLNINGGQLLPEWLEELGGRLPAATGVLLCGHYQEPELLIKAMQLGIREFLPLPLKQEDLEGAVERFLAVRSRHIPLSHTGRGRVVAVAGHKGGAGATTVAVNLAVALGELTGQRIALVDLGRPFPDVGHFLDQEGNYTTYDVSQNQGSLDKSFLQSLMQSCGPRLSVLHGCIDLKEQDSLDWEALERVLSMLRSLYPWVVVDLGHWLDGLFFHVARESDLMLLLTELTIPDLRNLKRLWPIFREWFPEGDKVRVVVNRHHKVGSLSLKDLEQIINRPVFLAMPSDYPAVSAAVNQGKPLAETAPRSRFYLDLRNLAQRLVSENGGQKAASPGSRLLRLFSRK
jgi:pilus assembly protein CpaE